MDIEVKNLPKLPTGNENADDEFVMVNPLGKVYINKRSGLNAHTHIPSQVGLGNVLNVEQMPASYLEQSITDNPLKVPSSSAVLMAIENITVDGGII